MDSIWFQIYLVGCVLVVPLMLLNALGTWFVNWITKTNVVLRNMKKVAPRDETSLAARILKVIGVYAVEIALSWFSVVVGGWNLLRLLLNAIREAVSSTPEAVRALRFPLRNNPDLSRESVWAHVIGLGALAGQRPGAPSELLVSLAEIVQHYPGFDRSLALRQLNTLRVVEPELIAEALAQVERDARRQA